MNVEVRGAELQDADQVVRLNRRWCGMRVEHPHGFISTPPFSQSEVEAFVAMGELVVAHSSGVLAGYYLLDNVRLSPGAARHREVLGLLVERGVVPVDRVSQRAQAVVDTDYQGRGLSRRMLSALIAKTKHRYDYLFTLVHKGNDRIVAHQRAGWRVAIECGDYFGVLLSTSES